MSAVLILQKDRIVICLHQITFEYFSLFILPLLDFLQLIINLQASYERKRVEKINNILILNKMANLLKRQ